MDIVAASRGWPCQHTCWTTPKDGNFTRCCGCGLCARTPTTKPLEFMHPQVFILLHGQLYFGPGHRSLDQHDIINIDNELLLLRTIDILLSGFHCKTKAAQLMTEMQQKAIPPKQSHKQILPRCSLTTTEEVKTATLTTVEEVKTPLSPIAAILRASVKHRPSETFDQLRLYDPDDDSSQSQRQSQTALSDTASSATSKVSDVHVPLESDFDVVPVFHDD